MSAFNKDAFATALRANAQPRSTGYCAAYVRRALEAGGADTTGHPVSAKDWGPSLLRIGFRAVAAATAPLKGDVIVLAAVPGHPHGHIAGFDGRAWISDFVQRDVWGGPAYRNKAAITHYRL